MLEKTLQGAAAAVAFAASVIWYRNDGWGVFSVSWLCVGLLASWGPVTKGGRAAVRFVADVFDVAYLVAVEFMRSPAPKAKDPDVPAVEITSEVRPAA